MNFISDIRNFIDGKRSEIKAITNEEQTKTSLIMPMFSLLGYDVFNVNEFKPEYDAYIGEKIEKVDYAVLRDGKPIIIVEAKPVNARLEKHDEQLKRYFAFSAAKFAVLTNGVVYRFYTDLDAPNLMDHDPFFEIDLLDCSDSQINEFRRFHSDNFAEDEIVSAAEELKYVSKMKSLFRDIFTEPSDEFIRFVLNQNIYHEKKTSNALERFKPIVKKSLTGYINELVNTKIQSALNKDEVVEENNSTEQEVGTNIESTHVKDLIVTTTEELECFYAVKSILRSHIDVSRLTYKDTRSYFGILVDNKVTRWVCRIYLKDRAQYVIIPDSATGKEQRIDIKQPDDLYSYSTLLIERVNQLK